jgi:hypothetical protein
MASGEAGNQPLAPGKVKLASFAYAEGLGPRGLNAESQISDREAPKFVRQIGNWERGAKVSANSLKKGEQIRSLGSPCTRVLFHQG